MVETLRLPVVGSIAAGSPQEAIQQTDRWVDRLDDLFPIRPGDFLLSVDGESMIGDGILPGDFVLIHPQEVVEAGQIAAVMVHSDDATLKRFYPQPPSHVRLVPSNPTMSDMVFPADDVKVIGRFQGLIRVGSRNRT
jgi:repressor LexA